jgi:hypothetical protein
MYSYGENLLLYRTGQPTGCHLADADAAKACLAGGNILAGRCPAGDERNGVPVFSGR